MADDEQTNSDNDPGIEETTEATATTNSPPPQEQPASSHEHRNQWLLFGILAGILIGVVLVIALLRPLIFGRIVPAVMGDFLTPTPALAPTPAEVDEIAPEEEPPAAEELPAEGEEAVTDENELFIPAAASGGGAPTDGETAPVEDAVAEPEVEETAVSPEPAPEPVTHTVQVGDNLTKISQQYGVSIQEIMVANNLPNADYISVGQVLVIPSN